MTIDDPGKLRVGDALEDRLGSELAARGMRQTAPRRVIARAFFESREHLSLDDLLRLARSRDSRIGYATVYRTMKLLTEMGFAHERRFGDGLTRYEVALADSHHDHLICTRCGTIVEFEEPQIERLQEAVARSRGFRITSHRHEIYGICAGCTPGRGGSPPLRPASGS